MDNELRHYGVLGMKWGRRKYQNRDGTLTPAGKKRYNNELSKIKNEQKILKNKQQTKAKIDKLKTMRDEVDSQKRELTPQKSKAPAQKASSEPPKKKRIKDMTDDELRNEINRLNMEKQYKDLLNDTRNKQVSRGKDMAERIIEKVGEDLIAQVGKHYGAKGLNKLIGEEVIFANNKKK